MSNQFKIFIVEDDNWYSEILAYHLGLNPDYEIYQFNTGIECLKNLHKKPNVITLDYSLPDINGDEMLKSIKKESPETEVVIISGQEDVKTAVKLLKHGAYDYIVKDEDTKERIWKTISNIKEHAGLKQELQELKEQITQKYDFSKSIIGQSAPMQRVYKLMQKAAKTNITVSVTGETGTGKELVARAIHFNSLRKKQPFVAVNVAAIPSELIESELFGHEKGAFTGAHSRRIGKFEEAHKGTLFLDEIGEMDLSIQAKLLRALQEREIVRIGGNEKVKTDVRIIVATHKNLFEEVQKGNFREDLYYRLLGLSIELPPLRERGNDLLILAKHFVDSFCKENKLPQKLISNEAKVKLCSYPFPGNVRELKAVMELAVVMADDDIIYDTDITFNQTANQADFLKQEMTLRDYTRNIINYYLEKYNHDIVTVAKKLDIGKSTIYRMIKNGELKVA
jgi:DNA-binding NtrC family response regulator